MGETLEISTPYLFPDSTLVSVFLTQRGERFIVCEGGGLIDLLEEYCALPEDEIKSSLHSMARKFGMKQGEMDAKVLFFKDCTDQKLISSLIFDVANFATTAANALVSASTEEPDVPPEQRFEKKAERFIRSIVSEGQEFNPRHEIPPVPGVRFSAVVYAKSHACIISYINGHDMTAFRKNTNDTLANFKKARASSWASRITATIPFLNNHAEGYDPQKLSYYIKELEDVAGQSAILWEEKEQIPGLMLLPTA